MHYSANGAFFVMHRSVVFQHALRNGFIDRHGIAPITPLGVFIRQIRQLIKFDHRHGGAAPIFVVAIEGMRNLTLNRRAVDRCAFGVVGQRQFQQHFKSRVALHHSLQQRD